MLLKTFKLPPQNVPPQNDTQSPSQFHDYLYGLAICDAPKCVLPANAERLF
jgi:hypothetical protein